VDTESNEIKDKRNDYYRKPESTESEDKKSARAERLRRSRIKLAELQEWRKTVNVNPALAANIRGKKSTWRGGIGF
jgi:hypothetical protein